MIKHIYLNVDLFCLNFSHQSGLSTPELRGLLKDLDYEQYNK